MYEDVDSAEALGRPVVVMDDEDRTLSGYGVQEWQCIKVNTGGRASLGCACLTFEADDYGADFDPDLDSHVHTRWRTPIRTHEQEESLPMSLKWRNTRSHRKSMRNVLVSSYSLPALHPSTRYFDISHLSRDERYKSGFRYSRS